jgi:pyruvate carboxylase
MSPTPINRLLIANRGEIAARIISTALELSLTPIALYTASDIHHARSAHEALLLPSDSSYMDAALLVDLCKRHAIDAVHPGYGFLSESSAFAKLAERNGVAVVGPGVELLGRTGDKVAARGIARGCGVPVLAALERPAARVEEVRGFVAEVGYPVMIKAVDGGGGRGIRLVRETGELEGAVRRAVEESPSKRVFVEKAAVDGFLHVEVQIVGDGRGNVVHVGERQCSVQRRYQKVVEVAPVVGPEREVVGSVVEAAVRMARKVSLKLWRYAKRYRIGEVDDDIDQLSLARDI